MDRIQLAREIISVYERHGWTLRRALLCAASRAELKDAREVFGEAVVIDAEFDALWFARSSHANREAWELRLVSEQSYALFEAFEAVESDVEREDVRREMENRMRDYAGGKELSA